MVLSAQEAVDQGKQLLDFQRAERDRLDKVRLYWKGRQGLPGVLPSAVPREVKDLARIARVNICDLVVSTLAQSLFVDGFRAVGDDEDHDVWMAWQANRWDARQSGVHRAAVAYGTAYEIVLPGDPYPVLRGVSPRQLTAVYGEDPDWPMFALERFGRGQYRLYDDEAIYYLSGESSGDALSPTGQDKSKLEVAGVDLHLMGVCPVVRFRSQEDLDIEDEAEQFLWGFHDDFHVGGQIAPLRSLQDQIDITTFNLLVTQHYQAFMQRAIIGWTADSEDQLARSAASKVWTIDEHPDDVQFYEFKQANLDGLIGSRQASLRHAASMSQTPAHELIGDLVNLTAEALAAAEAGRDRKVDEIATLFGEAHEQTFWLMGQQMRVEVPEDAQVKWRDTSARAFGALVDGLGKLAQMLAVPREALWDLLVGQAGITRKDVEDWKRLHAEGDSFANLSALLERQADGVDLAG